MYKPVRAEGLQIEAVLNMGNCIYSVLLGTISALIVYVSTHDGVMPQVVADASVRIPVFLLLPLLLIYYLVDWHDLNRAPFFDEKIGMGQMCRWMLCILLIGAMAVSTVRGALASLTFITSLYIPLTTRFRNKELGLKGNEKDHEESFLKGRIYERAKYKNRFAVLVAFLGAAFAVYFHFYLSENGIARCTLTWMIILAWALMAVSKWRRSRRKIEPAYRHAVAGMLRHQEAIAKTLAGLVEEEDHGERSS